MTKAPKPPAPVRIPYVLWRAGRPRFEPGPAVRRLGFRGEDLRHPDGRWFTRGEALDWSEDFARRLEARRAQMEAAGRLKAKKRKGGPRPALYTVAMLFRDWQNPAINPRFGDSETVVGKRRQRPLAPATRDHYRLGARSIEKHDPDLYNSAVAALDSTIIYGLFESLWADIGLHAARKAILTLSAAISWARRRGKVSLPVHPCLNLDMKTPEPRLRVADRDEIAALVAAADALGRPEIGDMILLGVWTGQRQADRLALVSHRDGLVRGRRLFRQQKTGTVVAILEAPQLAARLAASAERRRRAEIVDAHVILDEKQGRPFQRFHYRHLFTTIRAAAAAGIVRDVTGALTVCTPEPEAPARGRRKPAAPQTFAARIAAGAEAVVEPVPRVADFRDQDLRDTAVTWMALAGATVPEICAITGHSLDSATTILRHYLARHADMGDSAIRKLIEWEAGDEGTGL